MMGSSGGVPSAGGGLADLAALVAVMQDPKAYQEKLAELADRSAALDARRAELDQQKADLKTMERALQSREGPMLAHLQQVADQKANNRLRGKEKILDEALAKVAELRAVLDRFEAGATRFAASVDEAEAAVGRFLKIAA